MIINLLCPKISLTVAAFCMMSVCCETMQNRQEPAGTERISLLDNSNKKISIRSNYFRVADIEIDNNTTNVLVYEEDSISKYFGESKGIRFIYNNQDTNKPFAEVESNTDLLIIRSPDESVFWKVTKKNNELEILNSLNSGTPIKIKLIEVNRARVSAGFPNDEIKLGEIMIDPQTNFVILKNASDTTTFKINSNKFSLSYGVLLIPTLFDNLPSIVIAEILKKNW